MFASTLRYTFIRIILALAAHPDYEIDKMDGVTTFLKTDGVSEIYMDQPQGFIKTSRDGEELVCTLKKALYGIR